MDLIINVPEDRVITVKLPEDVSIGEHHVVMVIDQDGAQSPDQPLFSFDGLWAGTPDVSTNDIANARREMWRKLY